MYDVFLSFTRTGHPDLARSIRKLLADAGISVFMDEDVPAGESISREITEGLSASRIMLVIYSASYNERWACQWELIHAYLAGAVEGSAGRRILVVNPEPDDEHITQLDAADSKFLRPTELGVLVAQVRQKLRQAPDPMGAVRRLIAPRWLPPEIPGAFGFVGRFPDLWAVHNVLSGVDKPLTVAAFSDGAAVVTGMPGIGKTLLVKAYGWLFGDAYPGGVFRVSVGGPGGIRAARARFVDEVRRIAGHLRIATASEAPEQVIDLVAEHLAGEVGPSLWIVDDLPAEVDGTTLGKFVIPAPTVRTVFTARSSIGGVREVPLAGLGEVDGLAVLRSGRLLPAADLPAARSIVNRLDRHGPDPLAVKTTTAAGGERLERDLVTDPLHEHNRIPASHRPPRTGRRHNLCGVCAASRPGSRRKARSRPTVHRPQSRTEGNRGPDRDQSTPMSGSSRRPRLSVRCRAAARISPVPPQLPPGSPHPISRFVLTGRRGRRAARRG